jgi:3-deoxy-D-arabino-heptulosonate 7-phosphate (DAHP) synthase
MAQGNTSVQVIKNPTATSIKVAVDAIIAALAANTVISLSPVGLDAIAIVGVEGA